MLSVSSSRKLSFLLVPLVLLLAIALLAAACGDDDEEGAETPTEEATTPAGAATAEITMIPTLAFDKTELTIPADTEVTVSFDNQETGIPHNWAAYTDDSASEAIAGANENICSAPCTGEVTVPPLEAGAYFFRCDVHPTVMTGTLTVE